MLNNGRIVISADDIGRAVFDLMYINILCVEFIYFLIPSLGNILPSGVVVAVPVIASYFMSLYAMFRDKININVIKLLCVVLFYVVISLFGNSFMYEITFSTSFIVYVGISLYIVTRPDINNTIAHIEADTVIATIIILFACLAYSISGHSTDINYMSLGYGLSLPAIILFELYSQRKKKYLFILGVIASLFILLYGNRGALVVIVIYYFIKKFFMNQEKKTFRSIVFVSAIMLLFILLVSFQDEILKLLSAVANYLKVDSYNLSKINVGSLFSDEGRDYIRREALEIISDSPLAIRGPGYMTTHYLGERYEYANCHNMVLELWVEYGLVFGTLISVVLYKQLISAVKICRNNETPILSNRISICMLVHAFTLLLFSSTLYACSALWIGISLLNTDKIRGYKYES